MKKLLISGPIFNTPSGPSGQGGKLYEAFKKEGFQVTKRSFYRNKLLRIVDTLSFVVLRPSQYDVVILQLFSFRAFVLEYLVMLISRYYGKQRMAVIRGGAFIEFFNQYPNWCTKMLNNCGVLVTPSYFIQQALLARGFNIIHIPNFIDNSHFLPNWKPKPTIKLLWVRAFHDIYKPEMAIHALAYLHKKYEVTLTMIGPDQGKLAYCKNLAKELNIDSQIHFTGYIGNDLLQDYYHSHSIYLNTTSYESFGVALMEAASCGIPIVSTNAGEIPYIWENGEDMLIIPDKNQEAFNEGLEKLILDESLQSRLSENARKKASKYTWRSIRSQWLALINQH